MGKKRQPTCQYGFQTEDSSGKGTKLMSLALVSMALMSAGLFGYNEFVRKAPMSTNVSAHAPAPVQTAYSPHADTPVVEYIKSWAGSRNRTEARKYSRTVAVLKQCGILYRKARKDYEKENLVNYNTIKTRIVPAGSAPQTEVAKADSNGINADMFKLDIGTTSGNAMVAAAAMADALDDPYPEEAYETRPSNDQCDQIKEMAKAGEFAVRV